MRARSGNVLRRSTAAPGQSVYGNLPPGYPTEAWQACYWSVTPEGQLVRSQATLLLPRGYASACPPVRPGEPGCIAHIRRWGAACRMSLLEESGFDPFSLPLPEGRDLEDEGQGALYWMTQATHFDLAGDFIIASVEHPFLLFTPGGVLAGSYDRWYTYLGAAAYYVSGGHVQSDFGKLWEEDQPLYQRAVSYLLSALGGKDDPQATGDLFARDDGMATG